jgi:hypothetical protein
MRVPFATLPSDARLWIFAAERTLTDDEQQKLLALVDAFLDQWKAHNRPLTSARELQYGQFLFVGVDEAAAGASGCSVDTMVRSMTTLERELGLELVNHGPVVFREGETIVREPRPAFAARARRGDATPETIVFNNTLTSVGELRAGRWEVPARESWHQRAFFANADAVQHAR